MDDDTDEGYALTWMVRNQFAKGIHQRRLDVGKGVFRCDGTVQSDSLLSQGKGELV